MEETYSATFRGRIELELHWMRWDYRHRSVSDRTPDHLTEYTNHAIEGKCITISLVGFHFVRYSVLYDILLHGIVFIHIICISPFVVSTKGAPANQPLEKEQT